MDKRILAWIAILPVGLGIVVNFLGRQAVLTAFEGGDVSIYGEIIAVVVEIGAWLFVILAIAYVVIVFVREMVTAAS